MIIYAPVEALRAHQLTRAKNEIRYYLNGIHFIGNKIQSTNGHVCLETEHSLVEAPDAGVILAMSAPPAGRIYTAVIDTDAGIVYWLDVAADKVKDLSEIDHKKARVAVGTVDVIEAKYPDIARVMSTANKPKSVDVIGIATEYLNLIPKVAKKLGVKMPFAKFEFNGTAEPMKVTIKTADGDATLIIMPARV